MVQIAASPITLDPSDPFDAALIPHRRDEPPKRADYAKDGDRSTTSRRRRSFSGGEGGLFNVTQSSLV
jgi:hypothetical protein